MKSKAGLIILAIFVAEVAATFEGAMLYAALPTLIREFGDPVMAGWLMTAHNLIGAVSCVLAGRIGDIYGRRRVMLLLLAVATFGSILSALTSEFALVMVGRSLQGLSVAVLPLSIGILRESLPANKVPVAVGLMTTAMSVGVVIGMVLGGVIVDHMNWHMLFVVSAVLLAASYGLCRAFVPEIPGSPPKNPIDWVEGLLPAPAIGMLLLGISLTKSLGWADTSVLSLIAGGLVLMAYWAHRSLGAKEPFIDLRLLGSRNIALASLCTIMLGLGSAQMVMLFSMYVQGPAWTGAGLGLSATIAGVVKLPSNLLSLAVGPLAGWIMLKAGMRVPIVLGATVALMGWILALLMPSTVYQVIGILIVVSAGTTMLNAAIPNVIVASTPEQRTSEAIGANSVIRSFMSAIGVQIITVLLARHMMTEPGGTAQFPTEGGYRLAMGWIAMVSAVAGVLGLFITVKKKLKGDGGAEREQAA